MKQEEHAKIPTMPGKLVTRPGGSGGIECTICSEITDTSHTITHDDFHGMTAELCQNAERRSREHQSFSLYCHIPRHFDTFCKTHAHTAIKARMHWDHTRVKSEQPEQLIQKLESV